MRSLRPIRTTLWRLAPLLILAACTHGAARPMSVTERDTIAACREKVETADKLANRGQIYSIHDPYTPSSSTGLLTSPTQGLSDRYARERALEDCIRNTGTQGTTIRP